MTRAWLGLAIIAAGCGNGGIASSQERPASGGGNFVRAFCGTPDETRLRAAHADLPPCGRRDYGLLEEQVRGHRLLVFAYGADACCTDVPTEPTMAGSRAYVDGARIQYASEFVGALGDLRATNVRDAQVVLQASLLIAGAAAQVVTAAEQARLRASWPRTAAALAARPPGLERTSSGYRMRVWEQSTESERGVSCRYLTLREAVLENGALRASPQVRYAEGQARGQPCGDPLP